MILYSVNPRSLGALTQWNTAISEAERLNCNCIHISPFHPVTATSKTQNGAVVSGSLYAITDHFTINPEFLGEADQAAAREQLKDFVKMAHARKMRVMAGLVFNHLAIDHPLVKQHPEFFRRNKDGTSFISGPEHDPWSDVVTIDYENPGAWNYFLGDDGYWLRLIDDYIALGFNAFRCDAVYTMPQLVWEQALNYARRKLPDITILAETCGITSDDVELMTETLREDDARIIYDLAYDDVGRTWDCKDAGFLTQGRKRLLKASHYGALGFVDSYAVPQRAVELRKFYKDTRTTVGDIKIGMTMLRDYAVACFTNNSVMLPRGFQWCIEGNQGVFKEQVSAEFFQQLKAERKANPSPLTLGPAIAEMHKLRMQIPHDAKVRVINAVTTDSAFLTAIQCDFHDYATDRVLASIILLLNTAPERGAEKFPETWFRKLKEEQTNTQRIQFGPDRKYQNGISGVAIVVVPGDHMARMALNQKVGVNAKPGEELKLTA